MQTLHPALVLITTPTGRDAALATLVLEDAGIATKACRDLPTLAAAVGPDVGAVLVAEEALCGPDIEIFLSALRVQAPSASSACSIQAARSYAWMPTSKPASRVARMASAQRRAISGAGSSQPSSRVA